MNPENVNAAATVDEVWRVEEAAQSAQKAGLGSIDWGDEMVIKISPG
jgi:hypothetical protein